MTKTELITKILKLKNKEDDVLELKILYLLDKDRLQSIYEAEYIKLKKIEILKEQEEKMNNIEINNTIMESAIGLNKRYRLDNLVNAKGKPLKRFVAYRNYYNISAGCDRYDAIQELVKIGFMNEYRKDFYEVTEKGIKYLENKYKIKIYFYD